MNTRVPLAPQAEQQLDRAAAMGLRLAVAESLTGGLLADAFVSVPGASRAFSGGIVAYDTSLKHTLLGVTHELLEAAGPVDGEVARQMARGVREACALPAQTGEKRHPADIGIATTGVAGPEPDLQSGQPAGFVWIGLSSRLGERAVQAQFDGNRSMVRAASVRAALELLTDELDRLQSASS